MRAWPENAEVESELRAYQRLFQEQEQGARLADLRQKAIDYMEIVQPFNPYLAGAVLDGTAINLVIYSRQDERVVFRTRDGRVRPRARIDAVRRLLADPGEDIAHFSFRCG